MAARVDAAGAQFAVDGVGDAAHGLHRRRSQADLVAGAAAKAGQCRDQGALHRVRLVDVQPAALQAERLEAAARQAASTHLSGVAPDVAALVRSVRIEVRGASPLGAAPPRRGDVEPDDVLRVMEMK